MAVMLLGDHLNNFVVVVVFGEGGGGVLKGVT